MTTEHTFQQRNPTDAELFQSLANALRRLGGDCDETAAAIQAQLSEDAPNFETAARAIDVPMGDLIEVFCDEMRKLGFIVAPQGRLQ